MQNDIHLKIMQNDIRIELNKIAANHLGIWGLESGLTTDSQKLSLEFDLRNLGYKAQWKEEFPLSKLDYEVILQTLALLRGGNVSYAPLFKSFPNDIPNQYSYLIRRFLGYLSLDTFDHEQFGANPITQMQDEELFQLAVAEQEKRIGDSHIEWKEIKFISKHLMAAQLQTWVGNLLYGSSPIKETLWSDIFDVIRYLEYKPDLRKVVIKETLARLAAPNWLDFGRIEVYTPSDLLRMFAFIKGQDVSLATQVSLKSLKFSKSQRRAICRFLNNCDNLEEDLLRHKGLWIHLLLMVHPGDFRNAFPNVVIAFDNLQNGRIKSFESRVINSKSEEQIAIALERPSVFFRKVSWFISQHGVEPVAEAIKSLQSQAHSLPLPLLMQAFSAIDYQGHGEKVIINKGGKSWVGVDNVQDPNLTHRKFEVLKPIKTLIETKLKGKVNWKSVWVDPEIRKVVIPLQARKQSQGLLNLARGTRISLKNLDPKSFIRLFVYWKESDQRTDLDLSAMKLNSDFSYAGYVSWNNYGNDNDDIVFSGDIQSAPIGASEFIDLNIGSLANVSYQYIVPAVLIFGGEEFSNLEACHAGWMVRKDVDGTKTFDAKTVAERVSIVSDGKLWVPFLLDIKNNEIVFIDLIMKGSRTIEGNKHFPKLAAALANFSQARPNFAQLVEWYIQANCVDQVQKEDAHVTIGLDDTCTINVLSLNSLI